MLSMTNLWPLYLFHYNTFALKFADACCLTSLRNALVAAFSLLVDSPNRSCQETHLAVLRWFLQSVKLDKETVVKRDEILTLQKKVYNAHAILFPYGLAYIKIFFHSVSIGLPGQARALRYNTALVYSLFCALLFLNFKPSKKVNTGTSHPETCSLGEK